jgi:hypothetical protein
MPVEPTAKCVALILGDVHKADASLVSLAFPSHLSPDFELLVRTGQFEGETEGAFPGNAATESERHAALAQIESFGMVAPLADTFHRDLYRDP